MNIDEMPAGREMDRLIAEKVMGWSVNGVTAYSPTGSANDASRDWCLHYSTEIAAAWEVVEVCLEKFGTFSIMRHGWPGEKGEGYVVYMGAVVKAYGGDIALAICRAALKLVRGATQEK
jgi:hypothetical protein